MLEIKDLFFTYAPWFIVLPAIMAFRTRSAYPKELKTILFYLLLSLFTQVISFTLWKYRINNLPLLHIYTLLEFLILWRFYTNLLPDLFPEGMFKTGALFFVFFTGIDSFLVESIFTFNTLARSTEAFIFIVCSIAWFVKSANYEKESVSLWQKGINYMAGGFLIYFSGSIMLFTFSNYINKLAYPLLMNIWTLHTLLLFILYISITLGLWQFKKS